MDESELITYLRQCASQNLNSPIRISESNDLFLMALNLVINKSKEHIKVYINFHQNQNSHPILDALNKDSVIKNLIDFIDLKKSKMTILTNEQKKVRESIFYASLSKSKEKLELRGIPEAIYKKIPNKRIDFLIGDKHSMILGTCNGDEQIYFSNFGDESAYDNLNGFFSDVRHLTSQRGELNG